MSLYVHGHHNVEAYNVVCTLPASLNLCIAVVCGTYLPLLAMAVAHGAHDRVHQCPSHV